MQKIITLLILCISITLSYAQKETQKSQLPLSLEGIQHLMLKNINGSVRVISEARSDAQLEIATTIKAQNDQKLDQGFKDVKIGQSRKSGYLFIYLDLPWGEHKIYEDEDNQPHMEYNWQNSWKDQKALGYSYKVDFVLRVPADLALSVSTINQGDVEISGHKASLFAANINGDLRLTEISGPTTTKTVNGDISVAFTHAPTANCGFKTVNGTIKTTYPSDLNAELSLKTKMGEIFTNYELSSLPVKVSQHQKEKSGSTFYEIGSHTRFQAGQGGPLLQYKTLNGDIYLTHE